MSITNRTLTEPMTASQLYAQLDAATGTLTGLTVKIGTEFLIQTGPAVGTVIPVRRGQSGSASLAHADNPAVEIGLATDFDINPIQATVYHDDTLSGTGSAGDPLAVVGSSSTVDVAVDGALDGDGSGGDPLAVKVDGVTIQVNGSNELEVIGGSGTIGGDVGATDNRVVRSDGTGGATIQGSAVTIADTTGVISGTQGVTFSGATSGTTALIPTAVAGTTTLTLPAATDTLVGKATTDTLTNKTLTTPTIGSFTNATHTHQDAAGGGTLAEAALALTDVTTNNATTSQHGFLKKLSNSSTEFMNGQGNWATPAGSGGSQLTVLTADPTPANDIAWIVRTGTAAGDSITLKVQVNGIVYELAGVTIS